MKLAIVAEGETEIGSRGAVAERGVAQVLVERLLGATPRHHPEVVTIELSRELRRGARVKHGEAETAALAVERAAALGCDGVILVRDADAHEEERRGRNTDGLASGCARQRRPIAAVLALQVRSVEAWLLADSGAFERAFGRPRASLPKPPEQLWGDVRDRASSHPKHVYRRALAEVGAPHVRDSAVHLAEQADLDVVARECPDGFGRFKSDFDRAFRPFACVVAADRANGIGKDNDLPWPRLKTDLKHFREVTSTAAPGRRNAVLMGRRTWDSVPEKYRPLPDRLNIVITRGAPPVPDGVLVAGSLDDALNRACLAPDVDQVFVVGGGTIYAQAFEHVRCRDVYLTRIDAELDCDAFIPDVHERFELAETLEGGVHEAGLDYRIERWVRATR
jgi:dihydrofolate reductase